MGNKLFTGTFITGVVLSLALSYFIYKSFTLLALINATFIVSLFYLIFGSALFLVQTGFFNGITYSFKRFFRRTKKIDEMIYEVNPQLEEDSYLPKDHYFPICYPILIAGGVFFIISLIAAFMI
ncbi:DUF3899 domain-containing protein [Virgibacillus siamensis]|uniref:DUF3899 domain-containing protein n=1 Tax=Virgibacillus siamensis TaxID=480071 RepID=UPI00098508D4|nr:DUF3899 domain-containing protein [Virgibacillus siamensis]